MNTIGFVGARGMVGAVLLDRMRSEGDLAGNRLTFFSTSQAGKPAPTVNGEASVFEDAYDIERLRTLPIIISCQGGDYTKKVLPALRERGWDGFWIDAASAKRMDDDSVVVLSPINAARIDAAIASGVRNYIGGNCTVSLLLMAINKLIEQDLIESVSVMSYQAYSGAGAAMMREFVQQICDLAEQLRAADPRPIAEWDILSLDSAVSATLRGAEFSEEFGMPLAANLFPWIDSKMPGPLGQTREEWKGTVEAAKITGRERNPVPIDGICVRVGAMRCHSQGVTLRLRRRLSLQELEGLLAQGSAWTSVVPNEPEATKRDLSPVAVSGKLDIRVGRVRQLYSPESQVYSFFTVGDQLLWGAAEPLRCVLRQILAQRR